MTSASTEVDPAPVFVDQTGLRGRRLRGLGWVLGLVCTGFVVAMVSGLAGTQSQAPALTVPGTADTTPPGRYLNAPLPAAPGTARSASDTTAVTTPDAAAVTTPDTTVPGAVTATAGTADQNSATATAQ
ncbi:hypothetical protein AB0N99_12520 [Streptomyces sp. NPDC093272]|uniref:hypothetical protein n=1 Tax=Streptomyces sp. NPDC093272 TaxID=3154981 RepID=UPI003428ED68